MRYHTYVTVPSSCEFTSKDPAIGVGFFSDSHLPRRGLHTLRIGGPFSRERYLRRPSLGWDGRCLHWHPPLFTLGDLRQLVELGQDDHVAVLLHPFFGPQTPADVAVAGDGRGE